MTLMKTDELREIDICQVVGITNQKTLVLCNEMPIPFKRSRASQENFLVRQAEPRSSAPIASEPLYSSREVVGIDQHLLDSVLTQEFEPDPQKRLGADRNEAFGQMIGNRTKTSA
jgi:hypothetical protein